VVDLAKMLLEEGIVEFGEFVLSSGRKSSYYIDMRKCLANPALYQTIVEEYARILENIYFDVIAGVATGGLVWASMVSFKLRVPMVYVRTEKKEYGKKSVIEGTVRPSSVVVVVDDVATTGTSIESAVIALRERGAIVRDAVVAVDREEGAGERLDRIGVTLHSILRAKQILHEAK